MFHHFGYGEEMQRKQFIEKIQEKCMDKEMGFLNRKGQKYLNKTICKN